MMQTAKNQTVAQTTVRPNISQPQVKTPCIGVCSTVLGDRVCRGCNRFIHEVTDWNRYTLSQKGMIQARLQELCHQACSYWLKIINLATLKKAAMDSSLTIKQRYTGYDIAYELLRKSGNNFTHLEELGLTARYAMPDSKPTAVLATLEEHLYNLSLSHYQRYFAPLAPVYWGDGG